jgi:hypothetical protein
MNKIEEVLQQLKNKKVTKVISGGANASTLILHFNVDEFCLFTYCVWRLESKKVVLTGWNDPSGTRKSNLVVQLNTLLNDIVKNVSVGKFYDLQMEFKSGRSLQVFCDVTPMFQVKDYDVNWSLCDINNNTTYHIDRNFKVIKERFM